MSDCVGIAWSLKVTVFFICPNNAELVDASVYTAHSANQGAGICMLPLLTPHSHSAEPGEVTYSNAIWTP